MGLFTIFEFGYVHHCVLYQLLLCTLLNGSCVWNHCTRRYPTLALPHFTIRSTTLLPVRMHR